MEKSKESVTLVDNAVEEIIQMIKERKMEAGDRLPNEYDLAKTLGIGRSTLREAIRRLVSRNILQVRQGSGTYVSDKRGVPEDPLGLAFMGDDPYLALELLEIRIMLEPEICAQVALKASDAQREQLQKIYEEMQEVIEAGGDYSEADVRFHRYLAECSRNQVLRNLIPVITSGINVSIAATKDEHRLRTIQEHRRIMDAVMYKDALGARYSMIAHLNTSRDSLMGVLKRSKKRK